jgi:hypothetical protein
LDRNGVSVENGGDDDSDGGNGEGERRVSSGLDARSQQNAYTRAADISGIPLGGKRAGLGSDPGRDGSIGEFEFTTTILKVGDDASRHARTVFPRLAGRAGLVVCVGMLTLSLVD